MLRRRLLLAVGPALAGAVVGAVGCQHQKEHRACGDAACGDAACGGPACGAAQGDCDAECRGRAYQEQCVHPSVPQPAAPRPLDAHAVPPTPDESAGLDPFDPRTSAAERPFGENLMAPAPRRTASLEPHPVSFFGGHAPALDGTIEEHNPVQLGLPEAIEGDVPPGPIALQPIEPAHALTGEAVWPLETALGESEPVPAPGPFGPLDGDLPVITPGPTARR